MIARPFIERPRRAAVIALAITIAGLIALQKIPVAQYPQITPSGLANSARTATVPVAESTRLSTNSTRPATG